MNLNPGACVPWDELLVAKLSSHGPCAPEAFREDMLQYCGVSRWGEGADGAEMRAAFDSLLQRSIDQNPKIQRQYSFDTHTPSPTWPRKIRLKEILVPVRRVQKGLPETTWKMLVELSLAETFESRYLLTPLGTKLRRSTEPKATFRQVLWEQKPTMYLRPYLCGLMSLRDLQCEMQRIFPAATIKEIFKASLDVAAMRDEVGVMAPPVPSIKLDVVGQVSWKVRRNLGCGITDLWVALNDVVAKGLASRKLKARFPVSVHGNIFTDQVMEAIHRKTRINAGARLILEGRMDVNTFLTQWVSRQMISLMRDAGREPVCRARYGALTDKDRSTLVPDTGHWQSKYENEDLVLGRTADPSLDFEKDFESLDIQEEALAIIEELFEPGDSRVQMFWDRYVRDHTTREIAAQHGTTTQSVSTAVRIVRSKIGELKPQFAELLDRTPRHRRAQAAEPVV